MTTEHDESALLKLLEWIVRVDRESAKATVARLRSKRSARNQDVSLTGLTTVNIDFLRHYRPITNVVTRPTARIGHGYALTGHHELLIPWLAAALVEGERGG